MRIHHLALALFGLSGLASAQILNELRIAEMEGGLDVDLCNGCQFGADVTNLGDLDNDGNDDLAVGSPQDTDGGFGSGAAYVLFLDETGAVDRHTKISKSAGGFGGTIGVGSFFGAAVEGLGDLDGDGVEDVAVGTNGDSFTGFRRGSVYILFLNANGTVKSHQKIEEGVGGFVGPLVDGDRFGSALANLGDLDGDGVTDLAVGAIGVDDGMTNAGAVWILFLNANGTVKDEAKISATSGGLIAVFKAGDEFGGGLGPLGDFDGDGVFDLAVGMIRHDPATQLAEQDGGAVFVLFLNADGTVKGSQFLTQGKGGFGGDLTGELFGESIAVAGDIDDDGVPDLYIGGPAHSVDDGVLPGAVWLVFMNADGTAREELLVTSGTAGLQGPLFGGDFFGSGLAVVSDFDGSGKADVVVGALGTDMGGFDSGAAWVLSFKNGVPILNDFAERTGAGNLVDAFVLATGGNFTPPMIGGSTRLQINTDEGTGHDQGFFFGFDSKVDIPISGGWTLLCIDSGVGVSEVLTGSGQLVQANPNNFTARYVLDIPNLGSLVGFEFSVQGLLIDSTGTNPFEMTNAWDFTVGL